MAITRVHTWIAGEILTATDLNTEFNNIVTNGQSVGFPRTATADFDGYALILDSDADTQIVASTDDRIDVALAGVTLFRLNGTASSPVNGIDFIASATGVDVQVQAYGSDTDIDLDLRSKGAGVVRINGTTVTGYSDPLTTRGDIVTRDASATIRRAIGGADTYPKSDGTDWAWTALPAADTTTSGIAEAATAAETTTGTDAARYVSPDALAGSDYGKRVVSIQVTDPGGDALTTGDGKAYFRTPAILNGYNLVAVAGHVTTVSSSGTPTIQINNVTQGADMLSTRITIDVSEKDSSTAATAAVIDTANDDVATADELRIDCDVAGTGAKGLIVEMTFQLP